MLIRWKAYGPQVITACFHIKKRKLNMDIIQCYTLTNDRKRGVLQQKMAIIKSCPGNNITIMMGDFKDWQWQQRLWWSHGAAGPGRGEWQQGEICRQATWSLEGVSSITKEYTRVIHKFYWLLEGNSMDSQTFWKLVRHYRVLEKMTKTSGRLMKGLPAAWSKAGNWPTPFK